METKKEVESIRDLVVISDTHFGSSVALMPPNFKTDDGQTVQQSPTQVKLWQHWTDFWTWTYRRLAGKPFALIHNGDIIDGDHHGTKQLITGNSAIQARMAEECLRPHVAKSKAFYVIRGTEAHVGHSAENEERIAERLGAVMDESTGSFSRWELWIELGKELLHFSHHIATTTSTAYKSSPLMRTMAAAFSTAGEWGIRAPSFLIRGHCHDYTEVKRSNCRIVTCPCWQVKTGFVYKFNTTDQPVIGGLLIKLGDEGVHVREKIYTIDRPQFVKL